MPVPEPNRLAGVFGEHTSGTGETLPWSSVSEWFASARNYWVCSTRPDGRPHATPVWGLWLEETFYFATHARAWKARNLAANPELVVHLESGQDAAIIEGRAERVTDRERLTRLGDAWQEKYGWRPATDDANMVHFALRPRTALSWQEGEPFLQTATRWRFSGR